MKYFLNLLAMLFLLFGCKKPIEQKKETDSSFYVGTYTARGAKGIYKYKIDTKGKLEKVGLVATTKNPSFLTKTKDNKILYAVSEANSKKVGLVKSFVIEKDTLHLLNEEKTGGLAPCYVTNKENYVLVANYLGGNVGLLETDKKGKLSLLDVQQHEGKGTTDRQKSPHAHSVWFHPTKKEIISVDLGTNQLWFSIINEKNQLVLKEQKTLNMAKGAGPRHLTFHPNNKWIYVLNELNNTVSLVKEKDNNYFVDFSIATLPKEFTGANKAADIHISKDGQFLYASNRGHESIVIYKVNSENGTLEVIDYQSVLGKHPRNFSLSPNDEFLIVANQHTDNIVSFKRDFSTGKLTFVSEIDAPIPTCILF